MRRVRVFLLVYSSSVAACGGGGVPAKIDAAFVDRLALDGTLADRSRVDQGAADRVALADRLAPDLLRPDTQLPDLTFASVSVAPSGTGTVVSSVGGIDCVTSAGSTGASLCAARVPMGTMVTLTATAGSTSTFGAFSGGGCAGPSPCTVTVNGATSVAATFRSALSFDGTTTSEVTLPSVPAFADTQSVTIDSTIEITATSAATAHVALVSLGDPFAGACATGYQLGLAWDGVHFHAEFAVAVLGATLSCAGSSSLGIGTHQLAGDYDMLSGVLSAYVDGSEICTATGTNLPAGITAPPSTQVLTFGGPSVADPIVSSFVGLLDDVRLSSSVRYRGPTATEPRHPTTDASTLGLWPMDEGAGTTVHDTSGAGGGPNQGTITGPTHVLWMPEP